VYSIHRLEVVAVYSVACVAVVKYSSGGQTVISATLYPVNDENFEGEKFRGLLSSSGMRGKVSQFFPSPPSYIHGFPTLQNSYERFNENFAFLR